MTLLTLPQDLLVAVLRKMCVRDVARVGCARRDNEWWLAAVRQLLFEAREWVLVMSWRFQQRVQFISSPAAWA
jgi:hypothetical protein